MTTEELDALDALLRSTRFGPVEVVDVTEIWRISATREDVVCDCAESKDADFIAALVNVAPRLLAEARETAILRAKLAESERHAKLATDGASLIPRAVHLALASVFGRGAEDRDPVQLASDVVAEAYSLRAKLIESETWRTELRAEMDAVKGKLREVTAERDAAMNALRHYEQTTGMMLWCLCCGAWAEGIADECLTSGHPCCADCALDAARKAVTR